MILADTSIWIRHFRDEEPRLAEHLIHGRILMHPLILGELACGNLKDRISVLADLRSLPLAQAASDLEAFTLLEDRRLWGRGLGWIDVHLLASALLSHCRLWTLDKRLASASRDLGTGESVSPYFKA